MTPEMKYYNHPKMQEKFREAMGEWRYGDRYYDVVIRLSGWVDEVMPDYFNDILSQEEVLRLPLPIDPVNPERGLWGMVDWRKYDTHIGGGKLYIFETDRFNRELFYTDWCVPTLALLKALAHQWGIGVDNG